MEKQPHAMRGGRRAIILFIEISFLGFSLTRRRHNVSKNMYELPLQLNYKCMKKFVIY